MFGGLDELFKRWAGRLAANSTVGARTYDTPLIPTAPNEIIDYCTAAAGVCPELHERSQKLVQDWVTAASSKYPAPKLKALPEGEAIQAADRETHAVVLVTAAKAAAYCAFQQTTGRGKGWFDHRTPRACESLTALVAQLAAKKLPLTSAMIDEVVAAAFTISGSTLYPWLKLDLVARIIESSSTDEALPEKSSTRLQEVVELASRTSLHATTSKPMQRVRKLLAANASRRVTDASPVLKVDGNDAWIAALNALLDGAAEARPQWWSLVEHCQAASSAKPSARWEKEGSQRLASLKVDSAAQGLASVYAAIGKPGSKPVIYMAGTPYEQPLEATLLDDGQTDLLRGLIWLSALLERVDMSAAVGDAAEKAFQKVPGHGPRNAKAGNACLWALSRMGSMTAVAQLSRLKARVKHASARTQIVKALSTAAERLGLSMDDLEELAVPTFGMTAVGVLRKTIGTGAVELQITPGNHVELHWYKAAADAKPLKSPPASMKEANAGEIAAVKKTAKEIERMLPALRDRLDRMLRYQRSWPTAVWRERYADHPLMGSLARRLIWRVRTASGSRLIGFAAGGWIDVNDQPVACAEQNVTVSLWHPIESDAAEVCQWREWLQRNEVSQPFKQAYREIYLLTEAERNTDTYSNRFAAHVLKQHQLNALCQQRGWSYTLMGAWDCSSTPTLTDPALGWLVEYWVQPIGEYPADTSDMGIFLYVVTDQVRFYPLHGDGPASLKDVPPLVFSELMRDVDLFVGVTSVGNDPEWIDGGPGGQYGGYWREVSFGALSASAETRREVLERLLPRLRIADRCRLEDRFLIVRGDLRSYKIHLGSSNILMKPNDQYLCIVAARGSALDGHKNIFLPFEGDNTLAVILSKALLLAEDAKITDPTIVRQIRL